MIRTLIVDDEPLARGKLRKLLSTENDVEVVAEAGDGASAVDAIFNHAPDLVFLDVQMPELDGFGVLDSLGSRCPACVIFVTAHDDFALKAFDVHAIDYLLKPYDRERFAKALARARTVLNEPHKDGKKLAQQLSGLLKDVLRRTDFTERIAVRTGGRITLLNASEISWIEAADNYVVLHSGKDQFTIRATMNSLEERLSSKHFLRISRSVIVNVNLIREIEPLFHGEHCVRLNDGTTVTCSRTYRGRLREFMEG